MFKKSLNELMKEKSTEVKSCPLWMRKYMNQKLLHARSVSMLALNLLCGLLVLSSVDPLIWPIPLSSCWSVNWSHSKPESWLLLAKGRCGGRCCYLVLSIWCKTPDLRFWGRSCEHTRVFSVWVLGNVWDSGAV